MLIDIVILPPANISKAVGNFNKNLKKQLPLRWVVDNLKLTPHISLYHLKIGKNELNNVVSKVYEIVKTHKKIPIDFAEINGHDPYFGIGIVKTKKLYTLHKQVVRKLKVFRNGQMPFIHPPKTLQAKHYAKIYGVFGIFGKFNPHITLGAINKKSNYPEVLGKIKSHQRHFRSFVGDTVAVAGVDKYWQVNKIIKKFKLN